MTRLASTTSGPSLRPPLERRRRCTQQYVARISCVAALIVGFAPFALAGERYELGTGDKLRVMIFDRPELSGAYTVRPPGTLSIPVVGEIAVSGSTPAILERRIAELLQLQSEGASALVSAEVIEYRAFYILGAVKSPGRYPYVPGIKLVQAIAIAGGMLSLDDVPPDRRFDLYRARERLRRDQRALGLALARRARLRAELQEQTEIAFPQELTSYIREPDLERIKQVEHTILAQARDNLDREAKALVATHSIITEQVTAYQEQLSSKGEEAQILRDDLTSLSRATGAISKLERSRLERVAISIEGERSRVVALIAGAKEKLHRNESTFRRIRDERQLEVAESLEEAEAELGQLRISIEETSAALLGVEFPGAAEDLGRASTFLGTVIVRAMGEGTKELPATELTPVRPGDVIKVTHAALRSSGRDEVRSR